MTRIAVVGANGQVGTELCLRMRQADGVEVVPVARNVSGSAFLRLNEMNCRHGRISDEADARGLIGDCEVVVNLALSTSGIPRVDRETNRRIVHGITAAAKPGAPIIFASTIMVYAPDMRLRLPDSYGMEKLTAERMLRRRCRVSGNPLFIFRLGHVLGPLQNITRKIEAEIRARKVALPHRGLPASNTVFASTIVEAILQVARQAQAPGTYDLVTSPQWSWLDIYQYYASRLGLSLELWDADQRGSWNSSSGALRSWLRYMRQNQWLRERLMFVLGYLPSDLNQRIYFRYLQTRASAEINALREAAVEPSVQDWRELRIHPMPHLADPLTLESRYPLQCTINYSGERAQTVPHHSA